MKELIKFDKCGNDLLLTNRKLVGANKRPLNCAGYFVTNFVWNQKTSFQQVYVCHDVPNALLGKPAIRDLKIITVQKPQTFSCARIQMESTTTDVINKFPTVFNGLGKIKGEPVHITTEEDTTPYHITAPRRVPIPLLEPFRKEIERMEGLGVIKKIGEPTEWCHPVVINQNVPKPEGKLRICLHLTKLNTVTKREFYQLESVNETLAKIGQECKIMSKLDANSGYWQLPLDEESQRKATFITPRKILPNESPIWFDFSPGNIQQTY